jgi:hypothetical protein
MYTAPFVCFLQHRYFRLLFTALAIFKFGVAIYVATSSGNIGVLRFQDFQLSIMNISQEQYSAIKPVIVNMMYKGCQVSSASQAAMSDQVLNISYPEPSPIDGLDLTWMPEFNSPELYVMLKGSTDHGTSWTLAGSSSYTWDESGFHNLDHGGATVTDGKMVVRFRPPWPFYVICIVSPCIGAVAWAVTLLCARFRSVAAARRVALASLTALTIICAAAAAGYALIGRTREAAAPLVSCGCAALVAAALWRAEPLLAEAAVLAGVLCTAERVATSCAVFDDCAAALRAAPPVTGPTLAAAGAALVLLRRGFCLALRRGVAADGAFYDREWAVFLAAPGAEDALLAAEAGAAALCACAPPAARHYLPTVRPAADGDGGAGGSFIGSGSGGEEGGRPSSFRLGPGPLWTLSFQRLGSLGGGPDRAPVGSLDVLYAQAVAVAPLLRAFCAGVAAACGGELHDARAAALGPGPGPGGGGLCGPGLDRWVRRGWVKAPGRAVRKAAAAGGGGGGGGGDASRVLDVCRGRIRVHSGRQLAAALAAVSAAQPRLVVVVRVRRRLRGGGDGGGLVGGFRVRCRGDVGGDAP